MNTGYTERTNERYQEPPEGLSWAMLDFDGIELPEGLSPTSIDAIEFVIAKLPAPFQDVSYSYQFSSSTGILREDGTPWKEGLNVHLFFWFSQPIKGTLLEAYLKQHCIQTGFFEKTKDRAGSPVIRYGVDFSLFRAVQPHYVAAPIIENGVICTLEESQRQRLISKVKESVDVPELAADLPRQVKIDHRKLWDQHKRECGWVKTYALTKPIRGSSVAIHDYYHNPNSATISTSRELVEVKASGGENDEIQYATLYFSGEKSPGSWYVSKKNPCVARRHGDGTEIALKELSEGAYHHVRDELRWFEDIEKQTLCLDERGYLPPFSSFATARNNLILAPTGTGKSTAFCQFASEKRHDIIIYAAQTIALTQQMESDLRRSGIRVTHYSEFHSSTSIDEGVYVTTNKSLKKIWGRVCHLGLNYILVIDEVHMALDEFMSENHKNRLLEHAITRATAAYFLTATMTPLQLKKLTETVSIATGALTAANFCLYEFPPVKANPLWVANTNDLGRDFVALLRHYQTLKSSGQPIPRTVIIAPTNKMKRFEILVNQFGLTDETVTASRVEATPEEIEQARVSDKPILISSPLFSLGLNFEHPPVRFWTYFQHLQVDTSQIVQTLNRANRTNAACEVRLYIESIDETPFYMPDETAAQLKVEGYFLEESELRGVLDAHFQVNRATYNELRKCEKVTSKALYQLLTDDSIQNFRVETEWQDPLEATKKDNEVFANATFAARERYAEDITVNLPKYEQDPPALLTHQLSSLREERRFSDKAPKEYNDKERALLMTLVSTEDVKIGNQLDARRLPLLFGEDQVYLSAQYDHEVHPEWMKAASEKTAALATLFPLLQALKDGKIDGVKFGQKMRLRTNRKAVLALAPSEGEFIAWQRKLTQLDGMAEEYKASASKNRRDEINSAQFEVARDFLATIGVTFKKIRTKGGWEEFDPTQPVVPPNWNLPGMERRLLIKAESQKHLPTRPIDRNKADEQWVGAQISRDLCLGCVHRDPSDLCALGIPIQASWDDIEARETECPNFKALPERLRQNLLDSEQEPTNFQENVGCQNPSNPHEQRAAAEQPPSVIYKERTSQSRIQTNRKVQAERRAERQAKRQAKRTTQTNRKAERQSRQQVGETETLYSSRDIRKILDQ